MINKNFIDYAVILLLKDKQDHFYSFLIFTFIVFILSSVLFISSSLQFDLIQDAKSKPDIVVEALRAGKDDLIHDGYIYDISKIPGVSDIDKIIDGRYYFVQKRVWFDIKTDEDLEENEMIIGEGVKQAMNELYYKDEFNFLTEESLIPIKISKIFPHSTNIISNNVIYLNPTTARRILNIKDDEYTKLHIYVPNPNEVSQIALKISNIYPYAKVTSTEDKIAEIKHIFYYKGGIFMILYVICMISFFILLKNQISLVYGEKKREIAILRSVGFCIKDIIWLKFIQNIIVCISAFLSGVALAYFYVFVFDAPFLRYIFLGNELDNFIEFTPILDFKMLFLIFIFMVIPFLAFIIIPSWKVAISEIEENLK